MPHAALPFDVRRFCNKVAKRDVQLERETGDRFTKRRSDMEDLINELKEENVDAYNSASHLGGSLANSSSSVFK